MASKRNSCNYKSYFIVAILYSSAFTGFVYGFGDDLPANQYDNLRSWHILDTRKILENATQNAVVSPKNLKSLLNKPSTIDLRFGVNNKIPGQGLILAETKTILRNPDNIELFYDGKIQEISFGDKNEVLKAINEWGSRNTDHKFARVFELESEISDQKVLIFNIFHFNETLQVDFKYSVNERFYVTPKNTTKVPSVETTNYFDYLDSQVLDAKVLRLPYSNDLSMFILLPHTKQGVDELLNNLGHDQLKRVRWMMEETRVNVLLPKFKYHFKTKIQWRTDRDDIDLHFSFGEQVDKVDIFHIATINFDGSAKDVANSNIRSSKFAKFHVDRPFVVYIEEDKTGEIMCIGKVLNPTL